MSFLDSILSSIQTGKPSQSPLSQPPASPAPAAAPKKDERKSPALRQAPPISGNVGTKRKAEDPLPRPPSKLESKMPSRPVVSKPAVSMKPAVSPAAPRAVPKPVSNITSRPIPSKPAPSKPTAKSSISAAPRAVAPQKVPAKPTQPAPAAAPVQSKPPPKGSFAAIMAQAKAAQSKAPVQAGMLRHQAGPKERLSKVERKRRMEEEQTKQKEVRSGKRASEGPAKDKPARQRDSQGPSYRGTAKPTQTPEPPAYRGTAGKPSSRGAHDRRHQSRGGRQNEYMGTDEEDEGDYGGYGGYDDYYSDASSDMEAGMDDVDREEAAALKFAKKEDEEELRQEMAAKQEKLDRQRKLSALASRKR